MLLIALLYFERRGQATRNIGSDCDSKRRIKIDRADANTSNRKTESLNAIRKSPSQYYLVKLATGVSSPELENCKGYIWLCINVRAK